MGLRLAIISNCSSEEVKVLKESEIYKNQNVYVLAEFLEHVQINKTVIDNE